MYFSGPSTSTASLTLCSAHANESTENIDEIVQDHDTFGTDENEEDSMDSLTMALMESRSAASNMASNSSYMSSLSANKIGGKKLYFSMFKDIAKGQINFEMSFWCLGFDQKAYDFFKDFCPSLSKEVKSKKFTN